jgi:hypothetical protein
MDKESALQLCRANISEYMELGGIGHKEKREISRLRFRLDDYGNPRSSKSNEAHCPSSVAHEAMCLHLIRRGAYFKLCTGDSTDEYEDGVDRVVGAVDAPVGEIEGDSDAETVCCVEYEGKEEAAASYEKELEGLESESWTRTWALHHPELEDVKCKDELRARGVPVSEGILMSDMDYVNYRRMKEGSWPKPYMDYSTFVKLKYPQSDERPSKKMKRDDSSTGEDGDA